MQNELALIESPSEVPRGGVSGVLSILPDPNQPWLADVLDQLGAHTNWQTAVAVKQVIALQALYILKCLHHARNLKGPLPSPKRGVSKRIELGFPVGIIGCGNVGKCIVNTLLVAGVPAHTIHISTTRPDKLLALSETGVRVYSNNAKAMSSCKLIFLAFPPSALETLTPTLKNQASPDAIIVSCLAGVTAKKVQNCMGTGTVVRTRVVPAELDLPPFNLKDKIDARLNIRAARLPPVVVEDEGRMSSDMAEAAAKAFAPKMDHIQNFAAALQHACASTEGEAAITDVVMSRYWGTFPLPSDIGDKRVNLSPEDEERSLRIFRSNFVEMVAEVLHANPLAQC
eukprot:GILK01005611.1.p1 GENE.GILK01005611.1~~GILK01005611.1.p1  ORF type:complete len:350 (+),score=28.41 GILK01005611.1:26-1051(+)